VREGVAMALQRVGRENMPQLLAELDAWVGDGPYTQRAAAAGLCEPALLKENGHAVEVLALLDRITTSVASSGDRRSEGFKVLRQALGTAGASPPPRLPKMRESISRSGCSRVIRTSLG